jgi:hypothetical protein
VSFKIFILEKVKENQPSLAYNLITKNEKPKTFKTMKKLLYTVLFVAFSLTAITSCQEEEVRPSQESGSANGGGSDADPLGK